VALDFQLLRKIHRLLKQINDIEYRIRRGPLKIKVVADNEANFLSELESASAAVKKCRLACDAKELQLDEREAKVHDFKGKLNAADSNKEFQLLKDRIAADEQANAVQQDEILEQLERLDGLLATSEAAKANYAKSQTETSKITQRVELETEALKSELERVTGELAESENELPRDIMSEYRRLVAGKGEDALGDTDMQNCGNCNQRLTTQMAAELLMKKPLMCQGCGCLMYVVD
jgi:predicted  nucleic acid-binding Zn-ribbon protein